MLAFGRDTAHFLRANARWLAGGFLLTLFSSFGQTFFIGLSGNDLRATFHLSAGSFGGLYMLANIASALSLPWLGRTLDLMPGWKVVRFTMPSLAAACVLVALAPNFVVLTLALYLIRLFGQGMMVETAYTEIGRWFVANRARDGADRTRAAGGHRGPAHPGRADRSAERELAGGVARRGGPDPAGRTACHHHTDEDRASAEVHRGQGPRWSHGARLDPRGSHTGPCFVPPARRHPRAAVHLDGHLLSPGLPGRAP